VSASLVAEMADQVEELIGSGRVWTLRVEDGHTPEQRALLIDTHGKVLDELRRRGHHDIRGTVTRIREVRRTRTGCRSRPGSTSRSATRQPATKPDRYTINRG
jgi:hypothetical protein